MPTQADRSSIDSIGSLLVWMLNHLINMILMHPGGGVSNYGSGGCYMIPKKSEEHTEGGMRRYPDLTDVLIRLFVGKEGRSMRASSATGCWIGKAGLSASNLIMAWKCPCDSAAQEST